MTQPLDLLLLQARKLPVYLQGLKRCYVRTVVVYVLSVERVNYGSRGLMGQIVFGNRLLFVEQPLLVDWHDLLRGCHQRPPQLLLFHAPIAH